MAKIIPPNRVRRAFTQTLTGSPSEVFPLLCPVREMEWVNGWDPRVVISESGVVELDCVFVTASVPSDAFWVVTEYRPEDYHLGIIKIIPGMVMVKIEIDLEENDAGTKAEISYTYTALGSDGDRVLEGITQSQFDAFMLTWEAELNHYLATGNKLARAPRGNAIHGQE